MYGRLKVIKKETSLEITAFPRCFFFYLSTHIYGVKIPVEHVKA